MFQLFDVYVLIEDAIAILKGFLFSPEPDLLLQFFIFFVFFLDKSVNSVHEFWS